jgi:glycosyltransferase involved in cell wall biosynthesis
MTTGSIAAMPADPPSGRRPHVALAIESMHNTSGGAERVLADVANGLFRRGYRVTVITHQDRNGPPFYSLDFGIERLDARARHVRRRQGTPFTSLNSIASRQWRVAAPLWAVKYLPKVRRLRKVLRVARPDMVVAFMPSMFPYVTLAALGTGTKAVASIHNVPERELGDDPERWDQNLLDIKVRRWSLTKVAAITVLLPSFLTQLPATVRGRARVIPNMVQPYSGELADVTTAPSDNTILAVGRLSVAKDHATLLRAWAEIESRFPAWRVRIIGRGPLYEDLQDMVAMHGLQRVALDEPTSEIHAAYASAKILAMPSLHEGFGLVTAEAMACGLPAIGFADCEGTNEIIMPGVNGVLVDPGDDRAAEYAKSLAELIEGEEERVRLGKQAPASIERFAPDVTLDSWERLIGDVVGRR